MKSVRIVAVGRIKSGWARAAMDHYLKLASRHLEIEETELKDAPAKLPPERRKATEADAILARLAPRDPLVALDETGRSLPSRKLAARLDQLVQGPGVPSFVIGGPYGLDPSLLRRAHTVLALGPMTLPHELARVVLAEQLFRAVAILNNLPYHND